MTAMLMYCGGFVCADETDETDVQLEPYIDTSHTGDMAPIIEEIIPDEESYNLILEANGLAEETVLSDDELEEYVFDRYTHETATLSGYSIYTYDVIYQQMSASEQAFYNGLYGACESYLNSTAYMPSTTTTSGNTHTVCGPVPYGDLSYYQIRYVVWVFMYENPQFPLSATDSSKIPSMHTLSAILTLQAEAPDLLRRMLFSPVSRISLTEPIRERHLMTKESDMTK